MKYNHIYFLSFSAFLLSSCCQPQQQSTPSVAPATPVKTADDSPAPAKTPRPSSATRLKVFAANSSPTLQQEITQYFPIPGIDAATSLPADDQEPDDVGAKDLAKQDAANHLFDECTPAKNDSETTFAPLIIAGIDWFFSQIIPPIVNAADSWVQDDLKQYKASYTASLNTPGYFDFFKTINSVPKNTVPTFCLRFSRSALTDENDPNSKLTLVADLVAKVTLDPAQPEVALLEPLRFYYRKAGAKTDSTVFVTFNLSSDVSYLSAQEGEFTPGFINQALYTVQVDPSKLKTAPVYKLITGAGKTFRMPPHNIDDPRGRDKHNRMTLTVTMAEAGKIPWWKSEFAQLLDSNKSALSSKAVTEVENTLGVAPPASSK